MPDEAGERALLSVAKEDAVGGLHRVSTRMWAKETSYSSEKLFTKVRISNFIRMSLFQDLFSTDSFDGSCLIQLHLLY